MSLKRASAKSITVKAPVEKVVSNQAGYSLQTIPLQGCPVHQAVEGSAEDHPALLINFGLAFYLIQNELFSSRTGINFPYF